MVDSGLIGISRTGRTPMWSTGFSGCIGVVMCGTGSWGALAHLNQKIQDSTKDLGLALSTLGSFIRGQTKDTIRDVLLYYGDPGANHGQMQGTSLTAARVKDAMRCMTVIDLRREKEDFAYGSDFVYDPGLQIVYTAPGGTTAQSTGLYDNDKVLVPLRTEFAYAEGTKGKLDGLGHKGWFTVP